jgi:hexosaminidase
MPDSFREVVLLPRPRVVQPDEGFFMPNTGTPILLHGDAGRLFPIAQHVREDIVKSMGISCGIHSLARMSTDAEGIILRIVDHSGSRIPAQGYELTVTRTSALLSASDEPGLFYAAMTLAQAARQCGARIPCVHLSDSPDFPVRGVMLDVSRDKVPTLDTLFMLVDLLSEMKINQFQLYTEHTFAYSGHRDVWAAASPITSEDILRLDRYCRERFVELVPNQNSFGHLNRWLTLPRYRHLAECPDGYRYPEGDRAKYPFSLNPTNPDCIAFLEGLYDELLPNFTSGLFNIGCDETWDLGQGRSAEVCRRLGVGRVYLDFLKKIHSSLKRRGKIMQFWGDILMLHPELTPELPRDCIALEWGYEADHPFEEHGEKFAVSGIPFHICPGTSSWNSIAGRTDNCIGNIGSAAENGLKHGASGLLMTDWGDEGHWQYLPVSYLGFEAGAAFSWHGSGFDPGDFVRGLDLHVFRDRAGVMGKLAWDLGNVYRKGGWSIRNGSFLFRFLAHPDACMPPETVTRDSLERTRQAILSAVSALNAARIQRTDAVLIQDEFANSARLLLHAVDRGQCIIKGEMDAARTRTQFATDLRLIIGEYSRLWMLRNRDGGLLDSVQGLLDLLDRTGEIIPSSRHTRM